MEQQPTDQQFCDNNSDQEQQWTGTEPCILGIDEAGRGPVLGPMVYTAAYCAKSAIPELNALGADDSKQLTVEQRDSLRKKIDEAPFLQYTTTVLSAQYLSECMLRKVKYNLNLISHDTALNLVQSAIDKGVPVSEVYVDTVGNPESYAHKFNVRFPHLHKVVVAKKADSTYRIVGAASIVAKTTRDRHIKEWVYPEQQRSVALPLDNGQQQPVIFSEGKGSGYPSDPRTKVWMESNCDLIFGFPTFVRFSWGTTKTLLAKKAVQVDWESDEEEDLEPPFKAQRVKTKDIKSFFGAKPKAKTAATAARKGQIQALSPLLRTMSLKPMTSLL